MARYKQKNEELANKLDVVMRRLLPDKDAVPVTAIPVSKSYDAATSMTFFASNTQYSAPLERFEILGEKSDLETTKKESQSSLEKLETPAVLNTNLKGVGHAVLERKMDAFESITAKEHDEQTVTAEQNKDCKSPGESSASSPSFICIGTSGLSSMDQTPPLGSLQEEENTICVGNVSFICNLSKLSIKISSFIVSIVFEEILCR